MKISKVLISVASIICLVATTVLSVPTMFASAEAISDRFNAETGALTLDSGEVVNVYKRSSSFGESTWGEKETVLDEAVTLFDTVMFYTGRTEAQLLYPISNIITVYGYNQKDGIKTYTEGIDFTVTDGKFVLTEETTIPVIADSDSIKNLTADGETNWIGISKWNTEQPNTQIVVAYTHTSDWENVTYNTAPTVVNKIDTSFYTKLKLGIRINALFIGDSITTGCNSSGQYGTFYTYNSSAAPTDTTTYKGWQKYLGMTDSIAPDWVSSSWANQVIANLEELYPAANISITNRGIGSSTSSWQYTYRDTIFGAAGSLGAVDTPDIAFIGFGLNEMNKDSEAHKENMRNLIDYVRSLNPNCTIVLVSAFYPNIWNETEFSNYSLGEQETVDLELAAEYSNIAVAPVNSAFSAIREVKEGVDYTGNCYNHPNDFGSNLYANTINLALAEADYTSENASQNSYTENSIMNAYDTSQAGSVSELSKNGQRLEENFLYNLSAEYIVKAATDTAETAKSDITDLTDGSTKYYQFGTFYVPDGATEYVNGYKYNNGEPTYDEDNVTVYDEFIFTAEDTFENVDEFWMLSHSINTNTSREFNIGAYELYISNDKTKLFERDNKIISFVNTKNTYFQKLEFAYPVSGKYFGVRVVAGARNSGGNDEYHSVARISEVALFSSVDEIAVQGEFTEKSISIENQNYYRDDNGDSTKEYTATNPISEKSEGGLGIEDNMLYQIAYNNNDPTSANTSIIDVWAVNNILYTSKYNTLTGLESWNENLYVMLNDGNADFSDRLAQTNYAYNNSSTTNYANGYDGAIANYTIPTTDKIDTYLTIRYVGDFVDANEFWMVSADSVNNNGVFCIGAFELYMTDVSATGNEADDNAELFQEKNKIASFVNKDKKCFNKLTFNSVSGKQFGIKIIQGICEVNASNATYAHPRLAEVALFSNPPTPVMMGAKIWETADEAMEQSLRTDIDFTVLNDVESINYTEYGVAYLPVTSSAGVSKQALIDEINNNESDNVYRITGMADDHQFGIMQIKIDMASEHYGKRIAFLGYAIDENGVLYASDTTDTSKYIVDGVEETGVMRVIKNMFIDTDTQTGYGQEDTYNNAAISCWNALDEAQRLERYNTSDSSYWATFTKFKRYAIPSNIDVAGPISSLSSDYTVARNYAIDIFYQIAVNKGHISQEVGE